MKIVTALLFDLHHKIMLSLLQCRFQDLHSFGVGSFSCKICYSVAWLASKIFGPKNSCDILSDLLLVNFIRIDGVTPEATELSFEEKLADLEEKLELAATIKSPGRFQQCFANCTRREISYVVVWREYGLSFSRSCHDGILF